MNKYKKIGIDVRISKKAEITRPEIVSLGNHISIDSWVYISTQIEAGGNFTNIGTGSRIVCATDDFKQGMISPVVPLKYRTIINESVIFEDYATLGVNCVVLPGVTLSEGTIVGANSLIIKSTKPWTIYAGSPAREIGPRDKTRAQNAAREMGY